MCWLVKCYLWSLWDDEPINMKKDHRLLTPTSESLEKCLFNKCNMVISMLHNIDGSVQDCSNSTANALELLQSCTKPSIYDLWDTNHSPVVMVVADVLAPI